MTATGENQLLGIVVVGIYLIVFALGWMVGQQR